MRTRLIACLTVALLALPVAAAADEHLDVDDPCYVNPESPECVDVLGEASDASEDVGSEIDEAEEMDEAEELTAESEQISVAFDTSDEPEAAATLARTGIESTMLLALALVLVLFGSALLFGNRRRRSHSG